MRLHHLRVVNFRQHADTDIAFGPGITAIVGPNGSGKTTLFEAIAWALYGNAAARGSRDSLRRYSAPARAPMRVEVEFGLGAHEYRVARGLYNAELHQDGSEAPVANSHQEVTTYVTRILGMDRGEFFNTYFTGQKQLAVMAAMGPTERAKFLSRLLGYEKLRLAQDRLRARRSTLRGQISGLEQGLPDAESLQREQHEVQTWVEETRQVLQRICTEREEAERTLAVARPEWTRMSELRESFHALDGDRRVAEQHVEEARRGFQRLDRELADALSAQQQLQTLRPEVERVTALRTELEELERQSRAAGQRRALAGQCRELNAQIAHVESRLRHMDDARAVHERARTRLEAAHRVHAELRSRVEKAHTAWVRARQDAETKRLALRDQYRDLQEHRQRIVDAGADGQCPTCARPLGTEYESVLATLARQLEEIKVNGRYFKQRVDQLAATPDDVQEAQRELGVVTGTVEAGVQVLADAEAKMREREGLERELARLREREATLVRKVEALPETYDADRHDVVTEQVRALEPAVQQAGQLQLKAERAEQLVQEAEEAERALSEREATARQLADAAAALGFSQAAYTAAKERHEAATAAVRDRELGAAAAQGDLKAAEAALRGVERRRQEREERTTQIEQLRRELGLHDELDAALQDLRADLNAKLRPDLSEVASSFLMELTDGRYHELEMDDQYRLCVLEDNVGKPVLSGGEEDVANLALRLAISQMVAERAGQPLSLLVLDEIFGGLDDRRRERVIDLLRKVADRFPQVVLISHIGSVREGVDRVLQVTLDPGTGAARVTEEGGVRVREDAAA